MTEYLIKKIAEALKLKVPLSEIHNVLIRKGIKEDEIFLLIRAGEIFFKHSQDLDKKIPFKRSIL